MIKNIKKNKFVLIILNYNTSNDTIDLINSVARNKNDYSDVDVVIVDNASTDGSGSLLFDMYANNQNINVIKNTKNLGFASGNNVGYKYAMTLNPDFIIFSNSDVLLNREYTFDNISRIYKEKKFAILGPDVYNPLSMIHQSPLYMDTKVDQNFIKKRQIYLAMNEVRIFLSIFFPKIINSLVKQHKKKNERKRKAEKYQSNVAIHGCFIVFSKKYMETFTCGICDQTFMYGEEDLLLYFCQNNNLTIAYDPSLQIHHYEGKSSAKVGENFYQTAKFKQNNMKNSMFVLKHYITNKIKIWY